MRYGGTPPPPGVGHGPRRPARSAGQPPLRSRAGECKCLILHDRAPARYRLRRIGNAGPARPLTNYPIRNFQSAGAPRAGSARTFPRSPSESQPRSLPGSDRPGEKREGVEQLKNEECEIEE
jgi:hypothetical protein